MPKDHFFFIECRTKHTKNHYFEKQLLINLQM